MENENILEASKRARKEEYGGNFNERQAEVNKQRLIEALYALGRVDSPEEQEEVDVLIQLLK